MARSSKSSSTADSLVEDALNHRLSAIEETTGCDGLTINGSMLYVMDDYVKRAIEARTGRRKRGLIVILETDGGSIELVQRIVETLRHHYREVKFLVPNKAMSAGTVLALSGDEILMNYYSRLGPTDPQILRDDRLLPAVGYLEMWDKMIKKSADGTITSAEIAFTLDKLDPAELFQIQEHLELSATLLQEWLVRYKFKSWKVTEKRKTRVTRAMKIERAKQIAKRLSDPKLWHSHGHGISMDVLRRKVGLQIVDFDDIEGLTDAVREYHDPLTHYVMRKGVNGAVHMLGTFLPVPW